jgi:hypothetical protein
LYLKIENWHNKKPANLRLAGFSVREGFEP